MSTEEDTFKKLRQTPWIEVHWMVNDATDLVAWNRMHKTRDAYCAFLALHGWEYEEFVSRGWHPD